MKAIFKACAVFLTLILTSSFVIAEGVPPNPFNGDPGNSSAAQQDLVPNSQPNCLGDLEGTAHADFKGPPPTQEYGQDKANAIGSIFTLGSVIGIYGGIDCSELLVGH